MATFGNLHKIYIGIAHSSKGHIFDNIRSLRWNWKWI